MSNVITLSQMQFNDRQIEIMRHTIGKNVPPDEFAFFLEVARARGLNPFNREIHPVMRGGRLTIQVGIDGFRKKADDSGLYLGQEGPFFCGKDGVWYDVWLENDPPVAAKVGILRDGFNGPMWAIARYHAYVQRDKDGNVTEMWLKMPDVLLAKCAEALGFRKTFPKLLGGLYVPEEMMQADVLPRQSKTKAPTSKEMCVKGMDNGLWTDTQGYYKLAQEVLGRDIAQSAPTPEERLLIDAAVDEAIVKRVVVEAVQETETGVQESGAISWAEVDAAGRAKNLWQDERGASAFISAAIGLNVAPVQVGEISPDNLAALAQAVADAQAA
jgi:phage recombination protein Bet